ncbi:MAG: hypothetical protein KGL39_29695 [Patescibacteria group bacterium]|nr:hypothetical protein [Patescibacteria group bacterium]
MAGGVVQGVREQLPAAGPRVPLSIHARRLGELDVANDVQTAIMGQILVELRKIRFGLETELGATFIDPGENS